MTLPPGWAAATGRDVFLQVTSGSRGWAEHYADEGATFVRIGNLRDAAIDLDFTTRQCVSPPSGAEGIRTALQPDDILVSITAEIGRVALVPSDLGEAYVNQHIALARPHDGVCSRFLAWQLAGPGRARLIGMRRGATKAGLTLDDIRAVPLLIAPLAEQKRIVAKLDAIFAQTRAARARLERLPALLDKLKRSILAAAFRGDLTADWRHTVGGRADDRGDPSQPPPDWDVTTLETVLEAGPTNGYSPLAADNATGTPTLRLSATTSGRLRLDEDSTKRLLEVVPQDSLYWLEPGDILIQRANSLQYVGIAVLYDGAPKSYIYPDLMMRIRVAATLRAWVIWALTHARMGGYFRDRATGTAGNMPKINSSVVRNMPLTIPPAPEIGVLCDHLADSWNRADGLGSAVARAAARIEAVERAALAKAFRGELVEQDPDDEPADVLLERIRAARTAEPAATGRGRNGTRTAKASLEPAPVSRPARAPVGMQRGGNR